MWEVFNIGVTAGLTTLGTWLVTRYTLRRNAEQEAATREKEVARHAGHLAVRVVHLLDRFVTCCCELVGDDGQPDADGYLVPTVSTPTISLPEDVDWKSISPDLMFRILALTTRVDHANKVIEQVVDLVAHPPDYEEYFEERIVQYGELGREALALANELRAAHEIPAGNFGSWEPETRLSRAVAKIRKSRSDAQRRQAREWKKASKKTAPTDK